MYQPRLLSKKDLPLRDKRVFFTSPRHYAAGLAEALVERGARPVWAPTIETWPMDDFAEIDAALAKVNNYDWIAFVSTSGVEALCQRLTALGRDVKELEKTKLSALGSDADALVAAGLRVDLRAKVGDPTGLIDELRPFGITGKNILVPAPRVIGVPEPFVVPEFIEDLRKAGAKPHRLEAYQTVAIEASAVSAELALLDKGDIDIVAFTSSAEQLALLNLLNGRKDVINRTKVAYMGSFSARTGKERGLNVDIVPASKNYSMKLLVAAMEDYFRK
jgi:uroporphyrinogen-III synthase